VTQIALFEATSSELDTHISREGEILRIPEGLDTIPCTHGIHRFPGKFIPNLPRYVIAEYLNQGTLVYDPFCGSGTTLVEAALAGRPYLGVDIDPLAVLVSRAKVTPLSDDELEQLEAHWRRCKYETIRDDLVPTVPNLAHWFSKKTIDELTAIKGHCLDLPERLRTFSLVMFSSIIRRVSRADDQTQKTYVSHTLPKTPPLPSQLFPVFFQRAISGMREFSWRTRGVSVGKVVRADACALPTRSSADIVTSPPYIDSIDYVYNQMLEYFWLMPELGLSSYDDYRALRKIPTGFRNEVEREFDASNFLSVKNWRRYSQVTADIAVKSKKEAVHIHTYFADLARHAANAAAMQSAGGVYVCVIGQSIVRGNVIPTVHFLQDIFVASGYRLEDHAMYEIRRHYMKFPRRENSGTIRDDHVLVFRR
jgi:hypothetical protein